MKGIIVAIQTGVLLFGLAACDKKESYDANTKDAVARITVVDTHGTPQPGAAVLIFDEKGYEKFQKERKTQPIGLTVTLPDGTVSYRLPYLQWFQAGSRVVTFVVMEEADDENYHIWAVSRTVKAADEVKIELKLDRTPTPDETEEKSDATTDKVKEADMKPAAHPAGSR